jgi:hypothetical protein
VYTKAKTAAVIQELLDRLHDWAALEGIGLLVGRQGHSVEASDEGAVEGASKGSTASDEGAVEGASKGSTASDEGAVEGASKGSTSALY